MERHFDSDLKELKEKVLYMGGLAQEMIGKSAQALRERDEKLTQEVFVLEEKVNRLHVDLDEFCLKLLALHQPMAVDLRFITAAMKINSDLERIADQAVNASQTCYYHLFKEPPVPQITMIHTMADICQNMLKESLQAFTNRDTALALSVMSEDEEEDRLKAKALEELIDLIRVNPNLSKPFVDLILLSKNMERIADHATNIAEDVIFMVLGKDVRHHLAE